MPEHAHLQRRNREVEPDFFAVLRSEKKHVFADLETQVRRKRPWCADLNIKVHISILGVGLFDTVWPSNRETPSFFGSKGRHM